MIPKHICIYTVIQLIYILLFITKNLNHKFGPHNEFYLYGHLIDNWKKWCVFMLILIFKNVILDYYGKLYENWYRYEIEEKYTKRTKSWTKDSLIELGIINMVNILEWWYSLIEYVLFLQTNDLQLFFPDFISKYIISNNYFHYNLMNNKFSKK